MGWLTWAGLDVEPEERLAFRRAGIAPGDLLRMSPAEVVDATAGLIGEERAEEYRCRATLLEIATPNKVAELERAGVRDRIELAALSPDELLCRWHDTSPYTGGDVHDMLAALIHAARGEVGERTTHAWWKAERKRTGFDPMRIAWTHRFGADAGREPWPLNRRLRIESLRVNAPIAGADLGRDGHPLPPFLHQQVTVAFNANRSAGVTYIGHWLWAARRGAFFRLEHLEPGATIEVVDRSARDLYEVSAVSKGSAPLDIAAPPGGLLLMTPAHLRWPAWLKSWHLPAEADPDRTWVQVAVTAEPTA